MIHATIICRDRDSFFEVERVLRENKIGPIWCETGERALSMLMEEPSDLLIVEEMLPDMAARKFIEEVVITNPMINCVIASSLDKEVFHETYEGLGILMQLPAMPGRKETLEMIAYLKQIYSYQFG